MNKISIKDQSFGECAPKHHSCNPYKIGFSQDFLDYGLDLKHVASTFICRSRGQYLFKKYWLEKIVAEVRLYLEFILVEVMFSTCEIALR